MSVVEGHGKDATADVEEPRGLLDRTQERSLLLRERGEEQVAERHPVQLLALLGLEPVGEEAHQSRVALGEDR